MSATTFRDALAELVVGGVRRRFYQLPNIDAGLADLPAQWPRAVAADHTTKTFGGRFVTAQRSGELVIVVRPGVLANNEENYDDLLTINDALETALDSNPLTGFRINEYTLSFEDVDINGTSHVAVVADITVQES